MRGCMYICMMHEFVCLCVCMYVCMFMCMTECVVCACVGACVYACMGLCVCVHVRVSAHESWFLASNGNYWLMMIATFLNV